MSLVCAQCSRVNPSEAAYCYYDGAALAGRSTGPVNAASAPFPNQFVFPNGTACRNFDQLALACQQNWPAAVDLLKQGFLGSFFGGLGRVDLAMAAQEAAKFPDPERGLDQLLAKLPTQALQAPKLQAEPSLINLGQLRIGQDRATELHLTNLGMRLLYGNVTTDCKWLTLGEVPGQPEKIFQFGTEMILPVQVRGQHLRAGSKPLEGHLIIDSNGGDTVTVTVRTDVPITPFRGGLFDGALTPRQIAEKAKANPKDGAPYFENGAIAQWYSSNGWHYPVQGPTMSGMGAIQQFFEALGVAKPPKVAFSVVALDLQGAVGQTVQASIDVTTAERKVVYGWATCDQSWVEIGKTKLTGKVATIPITIRIPSPAPPTLETRLHVMGNGNQKIDVPLKVTIAGGKKGVALPQEEQEVLEVVAEAPAVLELPARTRQTPMPAVASAASPFAYTESPAEVATGGAGDGAISGGAPPMAESDNPFAITESPAAHVPPPASAAPGPSTETPAPPSAGLPLPLRLLLLLLPAVLLGMCLLSLVVRDLLPSVARKTERTENNLGGDNDMSAEMGTVDPRPKIKIIFDEKLSDDRKDYSDSMTFAVHKLNSDDDNDKVKLNYYDNGIGNSVVVRIDGKDLTFGKPQFGKWAPPPGKAKDVGRFGGKTRTFEFTKHGIFVTQTVTLEPGDPVLVKNEYERPLNLCLAKYKIVNKDNRVHKVGLRILMDTYIGTRDDVPFTLPGVNELVSTSKDFRGKEVPDFVQVLEKSDLSDPGIVVQLNMRVSDKLEMPSRFLLTRYPVTVTNEKRSLDKWEVDVIPFGDDSSVVMYWEEKNLAASEERALAFTYGLGNVSSAPANAKLGLTVGGAMQVRGELTVVALVSDPNAKSITLNLPEGLEPLDGPASLTQPVPKSRPDEKGNYRPVPISWRVQAVSQGQHQITVNTDTKLTQARRVTITLKSLFN